MIGLDLSTIAKLVVIWIMLECYYVVDLILDAVWIILAFYCRLFYLTLHVFKNFYQRMNKPKHIGSISSFQNRYNARFSSTGFYFKSKVIEGSHKGKSNIFFNFWALVFKMYIFEIVTLSPSGYPISQFFSGSTHL